ncbi:MAG: TIGR03087 family PEP-CTERM/XrtA system glycosyltransferase [Rhodospirillales bacterium]|nr:TIGR03087 family PEP-CTERM/XrtA system glycosyltransferase [Rhodospirillales bacterium]
MADLLFLTQRVPYPPNKGEKLRAWQILRHFATRFRVHLGALVDDPADFAHRGVLDDLCASVCLVPLDRRRAKLWCLRGLLTGEALSVAYFRHPTLARWVDGVLADKPPAVFVFSSNMAPYVMDAQPPPGQRRVLDLVDVDSEKWRAYAAEAGLAGRLIYGREGRRIAALEREACGKFDAATLVSAPEAALLARQVPEHAARILAIANGVDHVYYDPAIPLADPYLPGGPDFVFTGTMDYPPNVDAVTWFADAVLPGLRARLPGARFWIVGHSPTEAVRRLATSEGITVTGKVEDVRPYLRYATAAVAPLRIARGIQNKVLEGMAMAVPVIASPEALEGIAARPGTELLVASGAAEYGAACAGLAADPGRAAAIGAAARARVLADHGWAARLAGFDRLLG